MCGSLTSPFLPFPTPRSVSPTALSHRWDWCDGNSSLLSLLTDTLSLGLRLLEHENNLAMLWIMFLPFLDAVLGRGRMGFGQRSSPVRVARLPSPPVGPLRRQHVCVSMSLYLHLGACVHLRCPAGWTLGLMLLRVESRALCPFFSVVLDVTFHPPLWLLGSLP